MTLALYNSRRLTYNEAKKKIYIYILAVCKLFVLDREYLISYKNVCEKLLRNNYIKSVNINVQYT